MPSLTDQNTGLRNMRRVATGVLLALAAVFLAMHFVPEPEGATLLIRAMAEAGMIGGLADWFAVEALFRRPLGLPIPHTALLPSNQDRAARNVGEFFDTYFMDPKQLRARLADFDPTLRLSKWLSDQSNALFISKQITSILGSLLQSGIGMQLAPKSNGFLRSTFLTSLNTDDMAHQITDVLKHSLHSNILDELLNRVQAAIDDNRESVVKLVQDRSRWWISTSVDQRIAGLLVDGVISVVQELADKDTDLRADFETSIAHMIDGFESDGFLADQIEAGKTNFAHSKAFEQLTGKLVGTVRTRITDQLKNDPDAFAELLTKPLQDFAQHLRDDETLRSDFNSRLFDALEHILTTLRPAISAYVTETIANWDSVELIDRFESAVGRDLQFIRINGAVLGALIGGVLYFFGLIFS